VEAGYLDYYQVLAQVLDQVGEVLLKEVDYPVAAEAHHLQVAEELYQQLELVLVLLEHPCNLCK
jgi:hypothetical protein